jgi:hypothetical protein
LLDNVTFFKENKRRDGFDSEFSRRNRTVIDVALGKLNFITERIRKIFNQRPNGFAGAAPRRSSTSGPMALQGPHHGAQKSTSTGLSDCNTSDSKFPSSSSIIPSAITLHPFLGLF